MKNRLLRLPQVLAVTGLSRSTLYDWIKSGRFPRPKQLGPRAVAWSEADVLAWIESLPESGELES